MVRLDKRAVALPVVAVLVVLAAGVAAELTETWFEYRARTRKELKTRAKTSLDTHKGKATCWQIWKVTIILVYNSDFFWNPSLVTRAVHTARLFTPLIYNFSSLYPRDRAGGDTCPSEALHCLSDGINLHHHSCPLHPCPFCRGPEWVTLGAVGCGRSKRRDDMGRNQHEIRTFLFDKLNRPHPNMKIYTIHTVQVPYTHNM